MIYLLSGGVNRSLENDLWVPIIVNNVSEAYCIELELTDGFAEVAHSTSSSLLSAVTYGFATASGYGHPVMNYGNKGVLLI